MGTYFVKWYNSRLPVRTIQAEVRTLTWGQTDGHACGKLFVSWSIFVHETNVTTFKKRSTWWTDKVEEAVDTLSL